MQIRSQSKVSSENQVSSYWSHPLHMCQTLWCFRQNSSACQLLLHYYKHKWIYSTFSGHFLNCFWYLWFILCIFSNARRLKLQGSSIVKCICWTGSTWTPKTLVCWGQRHPFAILFSLAAFSVLVTALMAVLPQDSAAVTATVERWIGTWGIYRD